MKSVAFKVTALFVSGILLLAQIPLYLFHEHEELCSETCEEISADLYESHFQSESEDCLLCGWSFLKEITGVITEAALNDPFPSDHLSLIKPLLFSKLFYFTDNSRAPPLQT
jgi:hypothetical protein